MEPNKTACHHHQIEQGKEVLTACVRVCENTVQMSPLQHRQMERRVCEKKGKDSEGGKANMVSSVSVRHLLPFDVI
jgi:hypothetical protein